MLIKLSDGVVHVGGSSFTQHYDNFEELVQADEKLRNLSKKLYVLGVNFGPYSDENYYKRYSRLFANMMELRSEINFLIIYSAV